MFRYAIRLSTLLFMGTLFFTGTSFAQSTDFNGDGKADMMWRNGNDGRNIIWLMNGGVRTDAILTNSVTDLSWQLAGTGDFDGDGKSDLYWRNKDDGRNLMWFMNGGARTGQALLATASTDRRVAAVDDFDGDGKADILWRTDDGRNIFWFMDGATRTGAVLSNSVTNVDWQLAETGDFNGDGRNDLLWRNSVDGRNIIWLMDGGVRSSAVLTNSVTNFDWQLAGTGDFDGDNKDDILWRNIKDGRNLLWFMNGGTRISQALLANASIDRQVAAVDDFDGDGKSDILWRTDDGRNIFWFMDGATRTGATLSNSVTNTEWALAAWQEKASSSIVGAWWSSDYGVDPILADWMSLTFREDGTYVHWESDGPPDNCVDNGGGLEYGQYTYNEATNTLTVMPTEDNNGCFGLVEDGMNAEYRVVVNGDRITFPDGITLDRVQRSSSPIVGGWHVPLPSSLTFLPNGKYIQYQGDYGDGDCEQLGVEYGSYSYDAGSDTLLANPTFDQNACAGLSDLIGPVSVDNDAIVFQGETSFIRVK